MNDIATGVQLVRFPADLLPSLRRALARERSAVEAATLLRQVGYESGESVHAALEAWVAERAGGAAPRSLEPERFWQSLSDFCRHLGWGRLEHEELHPGVAALDSPDWFEAASGSGGPSCHFSTGLLADLLGRVAGRDVAVMEVECRADGEGRCRFLFGSPEALEGVYGAIRSGEPYREGLARLE